MSRPVFEFVSLKRPVFELTAAESVVGRAPGCAVSVDGDGISDQHLRVSVGPEGNVYVQDLDSFSGTLRNGQFVYGRQQLADGDEIKLGSVVMRFRKTAAAPESMVRQTLVGVGPPPELSAAYAGRTVEMAPVHDEDLGVVVGTPEPEPTNNRTMQMDSSAIEALLAADNLKSTQRVLAPAAVPTFEDASATVAQPPPRFDDQPTIGVDDKQRGRAAFAPTMTPGDHMRPPAAPQPVGSVAAPAPNQQRTMMAEAPVLPKAGSLPTPPAAPQPQGPLAAPQPLASNQQRTMMFEAPVLPSSMLPMPPGQRPLTGPMAPVNAPVAPQASVPTGPSQHQQPPQAATMMAQAPVLPTHLPTPPAQQPPQAATMMAQAPVLPTHLPTPPGQQQPMHQPMATAQMPAPVMPAASGAAPGYSPPVTQPPMAQVSLSQSQSPYVAPEKGQFGSFSRAMAFVTQMFALAKQERAIIKPIFWDLMITTPLNIALAVGMSFVHSASAAYGLMAFGVAMLYFTDYICNSFTASLMYDYVTTGHADMANAKKRVKKSLSGILMFAAVSSLLEVASTYARERNDVVAKIVFRILRAIWSTATYVIMPAMVIEGVTFGTAFKRSKELMDKDPTGVGAGVVALSLASYLIGLVVFSLAYFSLRFGGKIHPAVGGILFFTLVNVYWSVTGWLKIAYSTCFYMWARECERSGSTDHALAPRPLRAAIDAG